MRIKTDYVAAAIVFMFLLAVAGPARATEEAEVRKTVERVFQQLKSREYSALYDYLPASSRSRISRERFSSALKRAQDIYELDHIDVGSVRVSHNLAVVDTVLYGRVTSPFQTEGKMVVQQYLVREDGKWRVATGDRSTIQRFLGANPSFGRKFPVQQPRIYVKRDGNWVEFTPPRPSQRRA
jgi:hypothetical protein